MKKKRIEVKKLNISDITALLDRARSNSLTPEDCDTIQNMAETLEYITILTAQKDIQLKRVLKLIFGIKSEKSEKIKKKLNTQTKPETNEHPSDQNDSCPGINSPGNPDESSGEIQPDELPKGNPPKGHGRNGADAFTGALEIYVPHKSLEPGDECPDNCGGKVYLVKEPGVFIYIEGQPPLKATVFKLEKLRCNLCGKIFQADLPDHVSNDGHTCKHFDETAKSMMAILRYGSGFPMNRLSDLEKDLGMPIPVSTIWEKTEEGADKVYPVYEELIRQGAQGDIFYNDDTGMKILDVMKAIEQEVENSDGKKIRTGIFTTAIVSKVEDHTIVLFFTGRKHAGENFKDLLDKRESDRSPPMQMCDGKSGNTPPNAGVIVCHCNTHARRHFVDVADDFPDQCLYVIADVFGQIYKNDKIAKERQMTPEQRLQFHQEQSGPVMASFHIWLNDQFDKNLVEPNSSLGKAMTYALKHWNELTRFLHVPGAPLDNNLCERILKKAILHRKNSMFYKNEHGAYIGDMFMSIINTCSQAGENPFHYLTQLQVHSSEAFKNPAQWLPWNYKETLANLKSEKEDQM